MYVHVHKDMRMHNIAYIRTYTVVSSAYVCALCLLSICMQVEIDAMKLITSWLWYAASSEVVCDATCNV